jgi:transposase
MTPDATGVRQGPAICAYHSKRCKNDSNDARSVAIAALRAHDLPEVAVEHHTMVMRVWARRYRDLGRLRTQLLCRRHAVLCELVPGGFGKKELSVGQATEALDGIVTDSPVAQAKLELARDLVADLTCLDDQRREVKRRTGRAVTAAGTSITGIYGVGPIVAGTVLGYVRDIRRFPTRDHFASYNGTAPIEVSFGPGRLPAVSPWQQAAQLRDPHGRRQPDPPPRQRGPRLLRPQGRRRDDRQVRASLAQTQDQRHALRARLISVIAISLLQHTRLQPTALSCRG